MAITKGAKKAHRASLRKRVFNLRRTRTMRQAVKEFSELLRQGSTKEAEAKLPEVYKSVDKAVKRGVIKPNTASRKKSRLVASLRKKEEVAKKD